jgi:hypothetical protein
MILFCPRKGAEVPDLNALKLLETQGFSAQLFLGQNKIICGRFGGYMGTINTSMQSGVLRMRLNVSTGVSTEVTKFRYGRWINSF